MPFLGFANFAEEETKSRFTEYSMSSSVIRRNEQLTNLDDRFEEFFNEYADEETGGLEMDEIEGERCFSSAEKRFVCGCAVYLLQFIQFVQNNDLIICILFVN